jgi:hypothetical protein
MRLSGRALVALLLITFTARNVFAGNPCDWNTHRYVVGFYQYQGVLTDESKERFEAFREMVQNELLEASRDLNSYCRPRQIALKSEPDLSRELFKQGTLSPEISLTMIKGDTRLLALFDGLVQKNTKGDSLIHSNIYLGLARLPSYQNGPVPDPVSENYRIDPDQYSDVKNLHLAATYFALAVDAASDPRQQIYREVEKHLLDRAREILDDIRRQDDSTQNLKRAVNDEYRRIAKSATVP